MRISLVAAMDRNGLIGAQGRLPWRLPADLRHFKRVTLGKPVIMGRGTWESIGRPLPGRENIVVSARMGAEEPRITVVPDLAQALAAASRHPEAMVIGGASLFAQSLSRAARMHLTFVDAELRGDTWFPRYDPQEWQEIEREERPADDENPYALTFVTLERRGQQ